MGPDNTAATTVTQESFESSVYGTQRVIGVYGHTQATTGVLRSFNFKLANEVHVVSQVELYNKIETDFARKTEQLNQAPELMNALTLDDQFRVYGLTMQGLFGDNKTPEPDSSQVDSHLLWQAWTNQKGLVQHQAKALFLQTVDGLW